jgi:hypothetical protein
MDWWVVGGIGLILLVIVFAVFRGWVDLSNKNQRSGGSAPSVLGIGDEVFAPARHEASLEHFRQYTAPAPAPLAGDGDKGVYDGSIRITLPGRGDLAQLTDDVERFESGHPRK